MEMVKSPTKIFSKLTIAILIIVILGSCGSESKEQWLLDEARFNFENAVFDLGLDQIEFKGPVEKPRIEDFKEDTRYVIYAWYHVYSNDTIWVYSKVDTQFEEETTVHYSKNIKKYVEELDRW